MKQFMPIWILAMAMLVSLNSCEVIGGIFKAGFWSAIILVVIVVVLILWLIRRGRG